MSHRRLRLAALAAVALALTACAPQPAPEPTPTGFASEDEAYAAAEGTYRAYVDALNERRRGTGSSADPKSFLIGGALDADIATEEYAQEQRLSIEGDTVLRSFVDENAEFVASAVTVEAQVCLDDSGTRVIDEAGKVTDPTTQQLIYGLDVTFVSSGAGLLISDSVVNEEIQCDQ